MMVDLTSAQWQMHDSYENCTVLFIQYSYDMATGQQSLRPPRARDRSHIPLTLTCHVRDTTHTSPQLRGVLLLLRGLQA